jgi:hypothetical protein
MAPLISNPRSFFAPKFHFEQNGALILNSESQNPTPEQLFFCRRLERVSQLRQPLPDRVSAQACSITFGDESVTVLFAYSTEGDALLFSCAEIFTEQGNMCDEVSYRNLWQLRRDPTLAYISFDPRNQLLHVKAEGHLIDLVLFFASLEGERTESKLVESLQSPAVQKLIANRWHELTEFVTANLESDCKLPLEQLAAKHEPVAELAKLLVPKTEVGFLRKGLRSLRMMPHRQ